MACARRSLVLVILAACCMAAARGADAPPASLAAKRQEATQALAAAREATERARVEALEARKRLDDFLGQHFTTSAQQAPPQVAPPADVEIGFAQHPERQRLEAQLAELRTERDKLLGSLTEAHPEVVDVEQRIAALVARLAAFGAPANPAPASSAIARHAAEVTRQWNDYVEQHQAKNGRDAAQFRRLFDDWQAKQKAWDAALAAETAAAEQLAALPAERSSGPSLPGMLGKRDGAPAQLPAATPGEPPRKATPAPAAPPPAGRSSENAQLLALVSLLVALAVAALAAVRLARSSADPIFASADEAAAALAIPVIGIVPAVRPRVPSAGVDLARRGLVVVGQVVLAIVIFSLIAYLIKNAELIWNDPAVIARDVLGV